MITMQFILCIFKWLIITSLCISVWAEHGRASTFVHHSNFVYRQCFDPPRYIHLPAVENLFRNHQVLGYLLLHNQYPSRQNGNQLSYHRINPLPLSRVSLSSSGFERKFHLTSGLGREVQVFSLNPEGSRSFGFMVTLLWIFCTLYYYWSFVTLVMLIF